MNVEIVGLNTHFTQPTTTVQFGPQITVNGVTVNSNTDLIANITTSYNDGGVLATPPGWQSVYVNSAAGTGFTTAAGLPTTTSGAGTGAMVSITASATGALTSCTATAGGSGYQVGDYVYPTQAGSAGSACQVTAVDGTTAITTMVTVQEQVITGFLVDSPALPSLVSVCVTGTGPYSTSTVPCVSSAQQGATVGVTITGSLTNWVQGTTEAILGAGVSIGDLTITSPTTATATIAVSPTAPVGGNSVIMFTGSQIVSGTGFSVTPGASLIYSVGPVGCNANAITIADVCGVSNGAGTPYVVTQLQTATLNIVGVGTHWLQGETTASFGAGVATDSLTITSPTTATAQITVLSTSPVGFAALTMTTDGEVTTLQQAIDIEEGFPVLLATSPGGGEQGNTSEPAGSGPLCQLAAGSYFGCLQSGHHGELGDRDRLQQPATEYHRESLGLRGLQLAVRPCLDGYNRNRAGSGQHQSQRRRLVLRLAGRRRDHRCLAARPASRV